MAAMWRGSALSAGRVLFGWAEGGFSRLAAAVAWVIQR